MTYKFDPELQDIIDSIPTGTPGIETPAIAREFAKPLVEQANMALNESGVKIKDIAIPGPKGAPEIPLRIYTPADHNGPTPALLYLHGGGFVVGSIESEHGLCLKLCRTLGIVLVSVDYRLAPEVPYPGGLDDCYTALEWTSANVVKLGIDGSRLGIFGQSAGAGLSAATTLLARDRQGPKICFQYLGIPELDDRLDTPSMRQFVNTPVLDRRATEFSWQYYLGESYTPGGEDVPIYAAPARAQDLSGLPPAHVTTMEFDPLRDEGVLYALKLMQAGVPVELHCYPGTFHGSCMVPTASVSRREMDEMLVVLRRGLKIHEHE